MSDRFRNSDNYKSGNQFINRQPNQFSSSERNDIYDIRSLAAEYLSHRHTARAVIRPQDTNSTSGTN